MTDDGPRPGLCAGCSHGRQVRSDRGSVFWLCRRSRSDARFPRYPRLPVLRCTGFEAGDPIDGGEGEGEEP